jgi:ankyrin repeat protein
MTKTKELYDAINQGRITTVRTLLADDRNLANAMTPFGTLLHVAAAAGHKEIVEQLIASGADVNARGGTFGGNALNYAASKGQTAIVHFLLSRGADMDVSAPERNPLFSAIYGGHVEIAKLLISNGINTGISYTGESMKNMDALAFAKERGQMEIADILAQN